MVEQNGPSFDLFATLKAIVIIGFPTYLTYVLQFILIFWLWKAVYLPPGEGGTDDGTTEISDSICKIDASLLTSALAVYWISLGPSYIYILQELDIVLFSKRVAYAQDDDDIYVTNLLSTPTKRIFVFLFVNFVEIILILATSYVGVGYL
jgi:hypothetical protein